MDIFKDISALAKKLKTEQQALQKQLTEQLNSEEMQEDQRQILQKAFETVVKGKGLDINKMFKDLKECQ